MDFIYLVQGQRDELYKFDELESDRAHVYLLSYDKQLRSPKGRNTRHFFLPNSTWAEGRNLLLKAAQKENYEYLIFLDDDVSVVSGSFKEFEELLIRYKPKIGLPLCNEIKSTNRYLPKSKIQHPIALDQIVQAYSRDVVDESIVLPFVTEFDDESWWLSCEINSFLILSAYYKDTLQFNEFEVLNSKHTWVGDSQPDESIYVGGITPEQKGLVRGYLVDRFGPQRPISGTLFHPRTLPRPIYAKNLESILRDLRDGPDTRTRLKAVKQLLTWSSALAIQLSNKLLNGRNYLEPKISE